MGILHGILKFRNPDTSLDINRRLFGVMGKGVYDGDVRTNPVSTAYVLPVPGQLSVSVNSFIAMGSDGMLIVHEGSPTILAVSAGQTQYVVCRSKFNTGSDPTIRLEVLTAQQYATDSDRYLTFLGQPVDALIILAKLIIPAGALSVLNTYIDLRENHVVNTVTRPFLRGSFPDKASLPSNPAGGPVKLVTGDVALAVEERQFYRWNGVLWETITDGDLEQNLDLHVGVLGQSPVLNVAHGGPAISRDSEGWPSHPAVAISVDNPGSTPGSVFDVQAAIDYFALTEADLDLNKVSRSGDSMTGSLQIVAAGSVTALDAVSSGDNPGIITLGSGTGSGISATGGSTSGAPGIISIGGSAGGYGGDFTGVYPYVGLLAKGSTSPATATSAAFFLGGHGVVGNSSSTGSAGVLIFGGRGEGTTTSIGGNGGTFSGGAVGLSNSSTTTATSGHGISATGGSVHNTNNPTTVTVGFGISALGGSNLSLNSKAGGAGVSATGGTPHGSGVIGIGGSATGRGGDFFAFGATTTDNTNFTLGGAGVVARGGTSGGLGVVALGVGVAVPSFSGSGAYGGGLYAQGSAGDGPGVFAKGSAAGGDNAGVIAQGVNGANGIFAECISGNGRGGYFQGKGTGIGIYAVGGDTSGDGGQIYGGAPNGAGLRVNGTGTGVGLYITSSDSATGLNIAADGIGAEIQSGGTEMGIDVTGGPSSRPSNAFFDAFGVIGVRGNGGSDGGHGVLGLGTNRYAGVAGYGLGGTMLNFWSTNANASRSGVVAVGGSTDGPGLYAVGSSGGSDNPGVLTFGKGINHGVRAFAETGEDGVSGDSSTPASDGIQGGRGGEFFGSTGGAGGSGAPGAVNGADGADGNISVYALGGTGGAGGDGNNSGSDADGGDGGAGGIGIWAVGGTGGAAGAADGSGDAGDAGLQGPAIVANGPIVWLSGHTAMYYTSTLQSLGGASTEDTIVWDATSTGGTTASLSNHSFQNGTTVSSGDITVSRGRYWVSYRIQLAKTGGTAPTVGSVMYVNGTNYLPSITRHSSQAATDPWITTATATFIKDVTVNETWDLRFSSSISGTCDVQNATLTIVRMPESLLP